MPADGAAGAAWLADARARCAADPAAVAPLFAAAARSCGRGAAGVRARLDLLLATGLRGGALAALLADLYGHGDTAERLAVLAALPVLDGRRGLGGGAVPLVLDALRANDVRLFGAVLGAAGPYAAAHLDGPAYRQAVLKCAAAGVPLDGLAGLEARADAELARMLGDHVRELRVAGRPVTPDLARALARVATLVSNGAR
ncbi:EboA domain-containing protein [Actinomadura parmotrematis]|uniref:EboA domain-containing protein n=1 Tax=Actinomadura parmotrematis TaxID=2864039 RepID=A0ABS7FX45_9ACTN|nr:EboA domain-containing protein [Actinomadura parmotrematis]MBW8484994.1 EboA domain-containing protein [Actinomadura parmotrematis]